VQLSYENNQVAGKNVAFCPQSRKKTRRAVELFHCVQWPESLVKFLSVFSSLFSGEPKLFSALDELGAGPARLRRGGLGGTPAAAARSRSNSHSAGGKAFKNSGPKEA
jgi:hypothetical protein